jgi:arylsulfatase
MRTPPAKFTLSGDGMCIGWDSGDAVSDLYETPGRFTARIIQAVAVDTDSVTYEDMELEAQRLLMKH